MTLRERSPSQDAVAEYLGFSSEMLLRRYRAGELVGIKPTSSKRTAAFKKRVVYAGKPYFCKR